MSLKRNRIQMKRSEKTKIKKRRPRLKLEDAPCVQDLEQLIELAKTIKFYKNIDTLMLWRIQPYLEKLNEMVGMEKLKETVFFQIIYYLQGMHTQNKNEEYLHTLILGPPGHGKCLAYNTPVILYDGRIKYVQDVVVGDLLRGDDNIPRNVLSITKGREKLYQICQSYGDDYIVNESHILSLKLIKSPNISCMERKSFRECGKFKVNWFDEYGEYERIVNCNRIHQFLETIPKRGTVFDIPVLEYIKRSSRWKSVFKGWKCGIEFEEIVVEDPYQAGCNGQFFPEYIYNNELNRLKFLAGLIDVFGNFENGIFKLTYFDISFLYQIVWLSRSLGFRSFIDDNNVYIMGDIQRIPVKQIKLQLNYPKDELTSEITIKPIEEGYYYGFTIDGNHRFLLGDTTVTHNTEVAKIIGKIYQEMEILSLNGPFKIAHREDFIAQYLGQTAIKTKKLLKSCIGGVLFIDEVYSLAPRQNDRDSFAKEALDTLTAFLSEHKNDFCCIAAGYEEDVRNTFFAMNKGLERRFVWVHKIDKYKGKEIALIFSKMVVDINWSCEMSEKELIDFFSENCKYFKNAGGDCETFLTKCKMMHSKRVFSLGKEYRFILTIDDLKCAISYISERFISDSPPWGLYT